MGKKESVASVKPKSMDDDEYSYPLYMLGTATTLGAEDENEAIRLLHAAVKEVTGRDVEPPAKPRIGFLP